MNNGLFILDNFYWL